MGCCIIEFDVAEMDPAILDVGEDSVEWGANEYVEIHTSDYPEYSGSYEADALFSEQVFPTAQTVMLNDFKVNAINYTEAPNDYGTTVTIGG